MLAVAEPSPPLSPFVDGYLCVRDLGGNYCGRPIRTTPRPGAVLTVNLGRPNWTADGAATPILVVTRHPDGAREIGVLAPIRTS